MREGYIKDPDGVFRIPRLWRWDYLANGRKRVAEVTAAPDNVLSFAAGAQEVFIFLFGYMFRRLNGGGCGRRYYKRTLPCPPALRAIRTTNIRYGTR